MTRSDKIPAIWQNYLQRLKNELRQIKIIMSNAEGVDTNELRARAQQIREDIARLT